MPAVTKTKNDNGMTSDVAQAIEGLKKNELKEVLDFIYFIKAKRAIHPSQAYFWTKKWQEWEREAEQDKKAGRVIGDGTLKNLFRLTRSANVKSNAGHRFCYACGGGLPTICAMLTE